MQVTFELPQALGEKLQKTSDANQVAFKGIELVYFILERSGKTLDQVTPELLEGIWDNKKTTPQAVQFSKNKKVNALLSEIKRTGGITRATADEIRKSGCEFREDFEFRHDQQ